MKHIIFKPNFIKEIKEANDIIDIASEYFSLEKTGNLYRTKCKHPGGDKNPSLIFYPHTQSFCCYSCGAGKKDSTTNGSDVISFIQWMEELEWQEAIIFLANKKGIEIPKATMSEEDRAKQMLFEKKKLENRQYWNNLKVDIETKKWFNSKGISDEDIIHWRLGSSNDVPTYAIFNTVGDVVAFSRRVNKPNEKYRHDPTSPIFKSKELLYGLNYAKKIIRKLDFVVLVEGFNDVILLQKYGIPAVALMGVSISEQRQELLKKYTKNVILFLDGDKAGISNTKSHIVTLSNNGFDVSVINILGLDPDDIAKKYLEDTITFINMNKTNGYQFLLNKVIDTYLTGMQICKQNAINDIKCIIDTISDTENKNMYYNKYIKNILST